MFFHKILANSIYLIVIIIITIHFLKCSITFKKIIRLIMEKANSLKTIQTFHIKIMSYFRIINNKMQLLNQFM